MVQRSKECHNEVNASSLQAGTEWPLKDSTCDPLFISFMISDNLCNKNAPLCNQYRFYLFEKVQVGKDQEKAQSEKDSHSKNRGGKKPN